MRHRMDPFRIPALLMLTLLLGSTAAEASVRITAAKWSRAAGQLTVKGTADAGTPVEVYDTSGRRLGTATPEANRKFQLQVRDQWPELLCRVRAKTGAAVAEKAVAGAPSKDCPLIPRCGIVSPASGIQVTANTDVSFAATAKLRERKAKPLKLEWDFGGGSMGESVPGSNPQVFKRPDTEATTVRFVRDNSRYRVRFSAVDGKRRYCEDAIEVTVGTPPEPPPGVARMAAVSVETAPPRGSEKASEPNDVVVLPYAEKTMAGTTDSRLNPNAYIVTAEGAFSTLSAQVFRKGQRPQVLTDDDIALTYQAASNPHDPAGAGSINSTSQNWPLGSAIGEPAPLAGASIQKTDAWERYIYPPEQQAEGYGSWSWITLTPWDPWTLVPPDEGLKLAKTLPPPFSEYPAPTGDQGRYMPGREQPFEINSAQDFATYWASERRHIARAIPITDIDDTGRVNPFPLLRVQAMDKQTRQPLATSDVVLASGRDVHCRGCHAKGGIAANDRLDWGQFQQAYHSSTFYGKTCQSWNATCKETFTPPAFKDSADPQGRPSNNLLDEEYAAIRNIGELHDFYDMVGTVNSYSGDKDADGNVVVNGPRPCNWCHRSRISNEVGATLAEFTGKKPGDPNRTPSLSQVLHEWHGQLQKNPNQPGEILRDAIGKPLRWDPARGVNPNSLFPVTDAQGNALPMEQNCLQCHAGHREPLFRDRHYTAGLTCNDCHGDMLAVGQAHAKPKPGPEGHPTRVEWYEEPDCGSCHTGNGNEGKTATKGFFSAGVLKQAFSAADPSATPLAPKSDRFAIEPGIPTETRVGTYLNRDDDYVEKALTLSAPLFRTSHDAHGHVACAACHGDSHGIWPIRDPKANDNVTAQQLQGFPGPIMECKVCHTQDAFLDLLDLDGGQFTGLPADSGILGGPHGLHPMRDEAWWKKAPGEAARGGWHDDVYRTPGLRKEDQCAACHGADHRGTRLSKTPVDLSFKLANGTFAQWKAGEEVGCNKCHSISKSFLRGPKGYANPPVNRDPVITSEPVVLNAIMGEPYRYQVTASDPDGDPLTFSLTARADGMAISEGGLVTSNWPMSVFYRQTKGPFVFPYVVSVSDGKGGYATQKIAMVLDCPAGQQWTETCDPYGYGDACACVEKSTSITITSPAPVGVAAGAPFSHDVEAVDAKALPLTYGLIGAPSGMSIDDKTGLINWVIPPAQATYWFQVLVTNTAGDKATQTVTLQSCLAPLTWHAEHGHCM